MISGRPRLLPLLLLSTALLLGGCGMFKASGGPKLKGERISVLALDQKLETDPRIGEIEVMVPKPYVNPDWPQPGGYADHAMHHLALSESPKRVWSGDGGKGAGSTTRIMAEPIVADGRIYVLDAQAGISALDEAKGGRIWRTVLEPQGETNFGFSIWPPSLPLVAGKAESSDASFGGGIAYDNGRVFVTSGYGFVAALDAATGKEIWRYPVNIPIRSAPTVNGGRVFATTQDNQLYALSADDGHQLWTFQALVESAGILGSASPAVAGDTVVAPFTSGELVALRVENGRTAWTDTLIKSSRLTPISELNDIAGRPVIDRGRVFAISHSGNIVSIDLRTGERIWTRNIAGVQTPWIAGDFIYLITLEGEITALSRRDGRVRWVTQLRRYKNQEDEEGRVEWSGPVLAGDRLIAVSSIGHLISVSPYTGKVLGYINIPDGTFVPPIVANESLYILTQDAELLAYR
ncbi:MAG TPA: PQQ-binding-like beta-propeller repeat protein [Alphaproteobacteria bacterium]|nr:PQQ-binding-like beta-propeller repeat protein [Alphaproteobacteria bacterium]